VPRRRVTRAEIEALFATELAVQAWHIEARAMFKDKRPWQRLRLV